MEEAIKILRRHLDWLMELRGKAGFVAYLDTGKTRFLVSDYLTEEIANLIKEIAILERK